MTWRTVVLDVEKLDAAALAAIRPAALLGRSADTELLEAMHADELARTPQLTAAEVRDAVATRLLNTPGLMRSDSGESLEVRKNYQCRRTNTPVADVGIKITLDQVRALPTYSPPAVIEEPADPEDPNAIGRNA